VDDISHPYFISNQQNEFALTSSVLGKEGDCSIHSQKILYFYFVQLAPLYACCLNDVLCYEKNGAYNTV